MDNKDAKPLNLTTARKKAREVNKIRIYNFEDGTYIKYYPIFPDTKIDELLEDYQRLIKEAAEKNIMLSDKNSFYLIHLMCIKHFTSLKKSFKDGLENHLNVLNVLIDAGYFKTIIEEVFTQNEFNKVLDYMSEIMSRDAAMQNIMKKAKKEMQKIENMEVINKVFNE